MGDISIALALEKLFELLRNTERYDFNFLTAGTNDVVMVMMELTVLFIAMKAFTQIHHIKDAGFTESFEGSVKSSTTKINFPQSFADFLSCQGGRLLIQIVQDGQAQRCTLKSLAAQQRF